MTASRAPQPRLLPAAGMALDLAGAPAGGWAARLAAAGVAVNETARELLHGPAFATAGPPRVRVVERSLAELDLPDGGTLPQLRAAAREHGFAACPPTVGPVLRLRTLDQADAPDRVLHHGRAPAGSAHVLAPSLSSEEGLHRGLYLRVVDGVPWLRGFACDDEHVFAPDDRWILAVPDPSVRPARAEDVPEMVRLRALLFADLAAQGSAARPDAVGADDWRQAAAATILGQLDHPDHCYVVAVGAEGLRTPRHGAPLLGWGHGLLVHELPGPGFPSGLMGRISSVVTEPAARGRGVGTAVTRALLDWLDTAGAEVVDLHASADAARLYRRLGFTEPRSTALRRLTPPR